VSRFTETLGHVSASQASARIGLIASGAPRSFMASRTRSGLSPAGSAASACSSSGSRASSREISQRILPP
jgi:hypothetical protein